jgi:hypothetical protein
LNKWLLFERGSYSFVYKADVVCQGRHVRVRFDDEHYPCSSLSAFILRKQGHIYEHENKEEKERERSDEDNKEVKR